MRDRRFGRIVALLMTLALGLPLAELHARADVLSAGSIGTATWNGLTVIAELDRWDLSPQDLASSFTPVLVTVINEGDVPVEVDITDFRLVDVGGKPHTAVPAFTVSDATRGASLQRPDRGEALATDAPDPHSELLILAAASGALLAAGKSRKGKSADKAAVVKSGPAPAARPPAVSPAAPRSRPARSGPGIQRPVNQARPRATPRVRGAAPRVRAEAPRGNRGRGQPGLRAVPRSSRGGRVEVRQGGDRDGGRRGGRDGRRHRRPRHGTGHGYGHHHPGYGPYWSVRVGVPLWWWDCHWYWGCYSWPYYVHDTVVVYQTEGATEGAEEGVEDVADAVLDLALKEGVLEPGHKVRGFLYFSPLKREVGELRWEVWGESGEDPLTSVAVRIQSG